MEVRTFEALNMKEAVRAIKAELGADAVILNTRNKPATDGSGQKIIEVTAAAAASSKRFGGTAADAAGSKSLPEVFHRLKTLEHRISDLQQVVAQKSQIEASESAILELKMLMLDVLRNTTGSALKDVPAPLIDIDRQLRLHEVDESQIASLLQHLRSLPEAELPRAGTQEEVREYYRAQAIRWMLKRIKIAPRWVGVPGTVAVHAFIGGTGVGKTTSIAKLGAHFSKKERMKTLVISHESLKIAGSDQLKVLCKVMDVPFATINKAEELSDVLANHRDVEMVLIDTSGRPPKNDVARVELEAYNELSIPVDFHLALSVTTQHEQIDRYVRFFSPLGIQSLMFTKIDEGLRFGSIFNQCTKWSLPLSFFGIGQSIPEDIERASRERVVERIFGI